MRTLGFMAAAVMIVVGIGAVIMGVMSLSDLKRYLKIRRM